MRTKVKQHAASKSSTGERSASADTVIATFERPGDEEVRITLNTFKGAKYLHVRTYWNNGETWLPTRRGCAFAIDQLGELESAIAEVRRLLDAEQDSAA